MDPWLPLGLGLGAAALGALLGTLTGLIPGLHVNNVGIVLVVFHAPLATAVAGLAGVPASDPAIPIALACLVMATAVAHAFAAFIPSIFLGAAEEDTALTVLPGHRLLAQGKGLEAVDLAATGALWGVLLALPLIPPLRLLMGPPGNAYETLHGLVAGILVLFALLLLLSERPRSAPRWHPLLLCGSPAALRCNDPSPLPAVPGAERAHGRAVRVRGHRLLLEHEGRRRTVECLFDPAVSEGAQVAVVGTLSQHRKCSAGEQRLVAAGVFLLAGALGWLVLASPGLWGGWRLLPAIDPSQAALLPLFAGLFGISGLLLSRASRVVIPPQEPPPARLALPRWQRVRGLLGGAVGGATVSWFPAVSGGIATLVARQLAGGEDESGEEAAREFLLSNAAVNTAVTLFSVVALFVTGRTRSGAAAAVDAVGDGALVRWAPVDSFPILLAAILLASVLAAGLSFPLSRAAARRFARAVSGRHWARVTDAVIGFLVLLTAILAGPVGLVVLVTATAVGLLPPLLGVRRVHLMGCLLVPVIATLLVYL